jgi:membrane-associated phospholipid phosphatase
MDIASRFIFSLNNSIITWLSAVFNEPTAAAAILIACFFLFVYKRTDRASPLFAALVLALLLIDPLKAFLLVPRPCADLSILSKVACPLDAAMPSGHAVVVGIFLMASVGTPLFPIFLPLAAIVSLSRVYLGLHTIADIAGGIAIGVTLYSFTQKFFAAYRRGSE